MSLDRRSFFQALAAAFAGASVATSAPVSAPPVAAKPVPKPVAPKSAPARLVLPHPVEVLGPTVHVDYIEYLDERQILRRIPGTQDASISIKFHKPCPDEVTAAMLLISERRFVLPFRDGEIEFDGRIMDLSHFAEAYGSFGFTLDIAITSPRVVMDGKTINLAA